MTAVVSHSPALDRRGKPRRTLPSRRLPYRLPVPLDPGLEVGRDRGVEQTLAIGACKPQAPGPSTLHASDPVETEVCGLP